MAKSKSKKNPHIIRAARTSVLGVLSITVRGAQQEEDRQGSNPGIFTPGIDANGCVSRPPVGDFEGMTRRERRAFNEYLIAEAKKTRSQRSIGTPKNRRTWSRKLPTLPYPSD